MSKQLKSKAAIAIVSAVALFFSVITALGHDYWLEPEQFFASQNSSINVHLYVGEGWKREEERALQKDRTIRFRMLSSKGVQDLIAAGREGQTPVANVKVREAGNYLMAMERNWSSIKLDAKKFTDYLKEEGLDSIIVQREQRGESRAEGRERYSRYLKSLIQVGDRHDNTYKRVLDQHLEIIPDSNPYEMTIGDSLRVHVYFEGKPLVGAKVFASSRSGSTTQEQSAKTSSEGVVTFTLDRSGEWMLHMVHMRRCDGCVEADWESFWAAYTFGMK